MSNDLKRALVKLQNWSRDAAWIIGRLGRLNSDGSYTINVSGKPGWVHVRLGPNGKQGNAIALNRGVPNHPNLRIRMLREHGLLVIYGDDISGGGNEQTGGGVGAGVPPHAVRHDRLGPDPLYIRGLAFLPMAARPTSPPSMAVTVERSYYRWNGTTYFLPATDTADLSAYVPGSATVQHMVIVSVDRSTGTVVVTDGGDAISEGATPPFGTGLILSLVNTLPVSHWPVAAVRFYNGQTTITAADIFADLRLWGGEPYEAAGVTLEVLLDDDSPREMLYDDDGDLLYEG